jgi:hypothetical protein
MRISGTDVEEEEEEHVEDNLYSLLSITISKEEKKKTLSMIVIYAC